MRRLSSSASDILIRAWGGHFEHAFMSIKISISIKMQCHNCTEVISDVNEDWTHKDQDKDKDQSHKDKDKDKDQTCENKDKDKD